MTDADSAVAGALDELAALGSAQDRELIAALRAAASQPVTGSP